MRKINELFRHSVFSSVKRRQTDNNKQEKEAEKRTDKKEATKVDQRNFKNHKECTLLLGLCGLFSPDKSIPKGVSKINAA